MADEMDEIIDEFVMEAAETLEKIDPLFVELETRGYDKDMLNEIFRGMHTLKGAAGFLGFQPIVDVAHRAESIMKRLRDGEAALSSSLMDVILKSVDALKLLISHIRLKDGVEENFSSLLGELDAALETASGQGTPHAAKETEHAEKKTKIIHEEIITRSDEPHEVVEVKNTEHSGPEPLSSPRTPAAAEEQVQQIAKEKEVVSTLRVDVARIDKVMDFAG
ncbi:MAG: Hpt domain-containing protein, partial [Nitrospirales bacterium]|nr:Hpt domain-containing protein [Nitrospirales bacterium]